MAFEPLEQRGMLAVVLGAAPVECEVEAPLDAEPLIEDTSAFESSVDESASGDVEPYVFICTFGVTDDGFAEGSLPADGEPETGGIDPIIFICAPGFPEDATGDFGDCWVDVDWCFPPPAYDGSDLEPVEDLPPGDEQFVDGGLPEDWGWYAVPDDGSDPVAVSPQESVVDSFGDGWVDVDWGSLNITLCGTAELYQVFLNSVPNSVLKDYREFVAENPTWPEDHGAGGIQPMVLTQSRYLRGAWLSTPGEALSFDAWLHEVVGFRVPFPVFGGPENATPPNAVEDAPPQDDDMIIVEPIAADTPAAEDNDSARDDDSGSIDLSVPIFAPSQAGASEPSADSQSLSYRDAAWASLFSSHAATDSTAATPPGGRRRGR